MQDTHAASGSAAAPGVLIGGRYRILDLIGRGGMASVYRAQDETLGRPVALKLFASDGADADKLRRETSEIRLLAAMSHHALVTLFDANVDGTGQSERAFLVMELVEGPTLQERIDKGAIAPEDVANMAIDLGEALHTVQAMGVVHRDIKPANILLSSSVSTEREFRAKLADFGIAYLADSTRLTTPGTIIGTAAYVSPEQAQGHTPGPESDIYSLGLVLLEALTRERAFTGTMVEALTARLLRAPTIPASLGAGWVSLLTQMTAMQPESRPTALQVAAAARPLSLPSAPEASVATVAQHPAQPAPTRVLPVVDASATATSAAVTSTAATTTAATQRSAQPASNDAETFAFAAPVAVTPTSQQQPARPAASARVASAATSTRKHRSPAVLIVVLLILLVVVGVAIWWFVSGQGGSAPALPAIDGPLGEHLDDLMDGVTP
ncbi:MAG: serine/threonine protein kinase [Glaciihabitans sp.]|nr:serine/threonine protein kinase [Glaciihabitans sp.]